LVLNIQPDEGISVSFGAKRPGTEMGIGQVAMNFSYREAFGDGRTRSAYATLLGDCVRGDATLFDRGDTVEAAWALVDPILDVWSAAKTQNVPIYPAGNWGRESRSFCWSAAGDGGTTHNSARVALKIFNFVSEIRTGER